jgi:O-antigen ligase
MLLAFCVALLAGLLVIKVPPVEGAALVGLAAVGFGTLVEPSLGLGAALFLGPLKAYLSAEAPQLPAQVGHVFVALSLGSWLMRKLSRRELSINHSPLLGPLLAFVGAALLSQWRAVDLADYGTPELIKWVEIVLLVIVVGDELALKPKTASPREEDGTRSRRLRWLLVILLGVGLFQAGIGIWQFGLRGEGPEHFSILGGDFFRAYGTFEQPNPYGGYLGMTAAVALGVVATGVWSSLVERDTNGAPRTGPVHSAGCSPIHRPPDLRVCFFAGGAGLVMVIALGASWSRGAWMGFAAAVLTMAGALPRKMWWAVLLVGVLAISGTGVYLSGRLPTSFAARLISFVRDIRLEDVRGVAISDANYAVIERLAHWQAALSMFRHNVWAGVGFGCYEAAYRTFALINWPIALGHAHNYYLNLLAETGLIGLCAYLALWAVAFWQTWRVTRSARGLTRGVGVGLLGAWTHLSVHHLLDNLYVNNVHLHIGVLLGLLSFLVRQTNRAA